MRVTNPEAGRNGYILIWIVDSLIMLCAEHNEYCVFSPQTLGGSSLTIVLYGEDVDKIHDQATASGVKSINPIKKLRRSRGEQFYDDAKSS